MKLLWTNTFNMWGFVYSLFIEMALNYVTAVKHVLTF